MAHNDKGQLTQRGTLNLFWDADGRIKNTSGSASHTYGYDGHGRRVSLRRGDGSQVIFVYSQQGELLHSETISTTGTIGGKTRYHYLDGKLVGQVAGATTYVHTDGLGSPTVRTDASGAVISKTQYDPWGDTWAGAEPNLVGYTGHVNDSATGLVYAQQRYYDPLIARFLSVDPIATNPSNGSGFGRYTYVENNPYRYVDPNGMKCSGTNTEEASCTVDTINGKSFDRSSLSTADKALVTKIEAALTTAYKGALALGDGILKVQQDSTGKHFADVSGKEVSALLRDSTANLSTDTLPDGRWAQAGFQNGDTRRPEITFFGGSIRGGSSYVRDQLRQASAHEPLHLARELRLFPMRTGDGHNQWFNPAVKELLRLGEEKR